MQARSILLLIAPALAGCQFSFSAGGLDYPALERRIADELNKNYAAISRQVSGVECPRPDPAPQKGDTFVCDAFVDGHRIRVATTITDDEHTVNFQTLDVIYDLGQVSGELSQQISKALGAALTVDCGAGLRVVEAGKSFDCPASDPAGATRTVRVTAGGIGADDRWEIL